MKKHTQGPWEIFGEDISVPGVPCIAIEADQKRIAEVCSTFNEETEDLELTEEDAANAALIAAAPTILSLLCDMVDIFEPQTDGEKQKHKEAIEWIKKARGES